MVKACNFIGSLLLLASLSQVSGLCSTCVEKRCHDNGECIIGCESGYVGEYCDEACPSMCLHRRCHLDRSDGTVTCSEGCEPGYCHIQCDVPCPGDCVTCDRQCGSCNVTRCNGRYYGADCSEICNLRYEKCDRETGQCIICRRGYFGDECNQKCTACFTRADTIIDTCLSGCDNCQSKETCPAGYHGNKCELPCSLGCKKPDPRCNRATGECSYGCVSGYHGLTCNNKCNEHCLFGRCNMATGECSTGCVQGYHGLTCANKCHEHCVSGRCNRLTGDCFAACVSGFYGMTCNYTCSEHCLSGRCNRLTGECSVGCVSGYHGLTCQYICNEHCLSGRCSRATGECSVGCVSGHHGVTCNNTCSEHCLSGRCNRATGECSGGCVSGYHGLTCNNKCNRFCEGGICNQHDGVCTSGCISGYKSNFDMCEKYDKEGVNMTVAIAVPIIILVCLVVGIAAAVAIWRRRRSRRCGRHNEELLELQEPLMPADLDEKAKKQIIDLTKKTKTKMESLTSGMIRVSAVDTVVDMLQSGRNWVTITGNAGDGKTTLAYLVMKELQNKPQRHNSIGHKIKVYSIEEPEECTLLVRLNENSVLMLDDRFGAFTSDQVLIDKWKNVMNDIYKHFTSRGNKIKVIFISRKNVVNEARGLLGHFRDTILDPDNVVDLSSLKIKDERLKILDYYLTQSKLKESSEVKQRVADLDIAHGFPHCSMMYPKLKAKKNDLDIEEFFKTPLKFLDITTAVLYTENCKDLFEMMIKNNGKFDAYSIEDDVRRVSLLKVEREQEGSYITVWKNGVCVFAHPSIYESVLSVICDTDPLFCVKYATLSVIRQKLTLPSDEKQKSPTQINVEPVPAVLKALAERFRQDILQGDYTVFGLRFCENEDFCKELVASCVYSCTAAPEQNGSKQFINQPGENGETMLWTALRNGRLAAVHSLVKAGADVDIQDKRGRTPLHHVCQLKNSTGAFTEDNKGDEINNPVDLDTLRLIITEGIGDVNIGDQYGQTPLHYLCQVRNSAAAVFGHDKLKQMVINAIRLIITEGRGDINISDRFGQTPLHYLFKSCNCTTEEIQWITTQGKGDLNKCEQHKSTPLHYLCANSSLQLNTVDLVIKEGKGDFNKGNEHGTTPFHFLCENGKAERDIVLQVVNTAKGDINKQDDNGITPLHVLCKGSLQMKNILTLINQGDKTDMYGNTPLHYLYRRRGINAEVLQPQLKQLPETDMKKQNDHGCTPLDYLTDEDKSLPWTDGMITRSAADLVLCRLKLGDNWTVVIGRAMILNSERVHKWLQVEDFNRALSNLEWSGERNSQFSDFEGTCSSPVPFSPSPLTTPPSYWETSSTLTQRKSRGWILLEMGFVQGSGNIDEWWYLDAFPDSVCVSVLDYCHHHPKCLCIKMLRRDQEIRGNQEIRGDQEDIDRHQVGKCVSLSRPTLGEEFTLTFGLVLDVGRGRVGFIDVERGQVLYKADLEMKEEVSPMFHVNPHNDNCETRMRLISGREICVTDRKIQLIQQALSD